MTQKQIAVAKDLTENLGKPIGQAMLDAGYKPSVEKSPQLITQSKAWREAMDEYLPDDKLFERHREALDATKVISARITNKDADIDTDDFIEVPDHPTRLKAVELGYKTKGYAVDPSAGLTINGPVQIKIVGEKQLPSENE